jgi:plasmid replication initiation protein
MNDIIGDTNVTNQQYVKNALKNAIKADIEYDIMTEKGKRAYVVASIFEKITWIPNTNEGTAMITGTMWNIFAEFSKGFRKYELECALKLESTYSLRLYQLLSGVEIPIDYGIEELKLMFGIPKTQYKTAKDFVKRVIETAKNELDEKAPYTFTYKKLTAEVKGKGRPKIEKIRFYPKKNRQIAMNETENREMIHKYAESMLSPSVVNLLMTKYEFSKTEIKNNIEVLCNAESKFYDLIKWLNEKAPTALRKKNPKGYLIQAIRLELLDMD